MPSLTVSDRVIHFQDTSTGPAVVLVHSGGLSSRQWSRLSSRLEPSFRVVAPDLLGSGASAPVPADAPFHFAQDVDVLDAVLDVVASPVHLVAHSYGGLVALTSALRRPERVRSLALYEPVAFGVLYSTGDAAGVADLESYDHDGTFFDDAAGGREPWMERFIDYWNGQGAFRALPEASRAAFLRVGRKVFQEVRSLTADRTPHHAYEHLAQPTLLLTGERSTVAAQRVCAVLSRTLPNASLRTLAGVGHMGPLTHGQLVNDAVAAHLLAVEAAAAGR